MEDPQVMGFNTNSWSNLDDLVLHDLGNIQLIRDVGIVLLLSHTFSSA